MLDGAHLQCNHLLEFHISIPDVSPHAMVHSRWPDIQWDSVRGAYAHCNVNPGN